MRGSVKLLIPTREAGRKRLTFLPPWYSLTMDQSDDVIRSHLPPLIHPP